VEKAVKHSADDERREREDSIVVGLPSAGRRQFRHKGIVAEEGEPEEGHGEKEGGRSGRGEPSGGAGEADAAVGDEGIE